MPMTPRMKAQLTGALIVGGAATLLLWAGQHSSVLRTLGGLLVMLLAAAIGLARFHPPFRNWLFEALESAFKAWYWREEEGRHHEHRGVQLDIEDDGRQVWIEGDSVRRALGRADSEGVLAARHSGRWKRGADGTLWLRVDAVVEQLAACPGRMEPKVLHLRRYLEREVLYPAAERRRRAAQG